jgi:hypothetical protein
MSTAIQVSPELKLRLQQKAEQAGLNIERFLNQLIEEKTATGRKAKLDAKAQEGMLLQKINTGFSAEFWEKYAVLVKKRNAVKLTEAEHKELIKCSDEIESANALRIKYLVQLAQLRNMDLDDMMTTLGITPTHHAL